MELGQAGILVSSLASKIMSAASLAKVSGVASGSVLAGLPSLGESCWKGLVGAEEVAGKAQGPTQGPVGGRGWYHLQLIDLLVRGIHDLFEIIL